MNFNIALATLSDGLDMDSPVQTNRNITIQGNVTGGVLNQGTLNANASLLIRPHAENGEA